MKFLKRLIKFVLFIIVIIALYNYFKPQINGFLEKKGVIIPHTVTDNLIIPSSVASSIPEEKINSLMSGSGQNLSVIRTDDGGLSVSLTQQARQTILSNFEDNIDDSFIKDMLSGNIISITHSEDYASFFVVADPGISEAERAGIVVKLFAAGRAYAALSGSETEDVQVDFTDRSSGRVIGTYNSSNIAAGLASDITSISGDLIGQVLSASGFIR